MAQSILTSIKKIIGYVESDTSFDDVVILNINSVFSTLNQLGVGPEEGFMIEDATTTWDAFLGTDKRLNQVKTYVYLRVAMIFDPPATSFGIESMNEQIQKLEWSINVQREGESWTDPSLSVTS